MASLLAQVTALAEAEKPALRAFQVAAASEAAKAERARAQRSEYDRHVETRVLLETVLAAVHRLPAAAVVRRGQERSKKVGKLLAQADTLCAQVAETMAAGLDVQAAHHRIRGRGQEVMDGPPRRKRPRGEADPELTAELEAFGERLDAVRPTWAATVEEWRAKTRVSKAAFKVVDQGVFAQVEELMADPERLRRRAFRSREESREQRIRVPGVDDAAETDNDDDDDDGVDPTTYDDASFYQTLLRDLTDAGGAGTEAVRGIKQRKKVKKDVDRKASKGRKLRYNLHPKLENFMYPVANDANTMTMDVDILFTSLFGGAHASQPNPAGALNGLLASQEVDEDRSGEGQASSESDVE